LGGAWQWSVRKVLSLWVRATIKPDDAAAAIAARARPICYVLERESQTDLAVLNMVCAALRLPRPDKAYFELIRPAGLFTSRAEGWGLVLNEMVESGLPVYATAAGGVEDIQCTVGSFIQSFPPTLGARPPSPPAEEARARYEARFRWPAIAARYMESIALKAS